MVSGDASGFSRPSGDDHRAWLWVVTILSVLYSGTFFGARLFGKYGLLWWDDVVLGVGYLLGIGRWAVVMTAISLGLGADIASIGVNSVSLRSTIAALAFTSRVFLLICHWLSKASVVVFTRKVFDGDLNQEVLIFSIAFGTLLVSGIAAVLAGFAGCNPPEMIYGHQDAFCSAITARWVVICVLDIISELIIIATPIVLLRPIRMNAAKKRQVYVLFSFRLGVIAFSIGQTVAYLKFLDGGRTSIGLTPTLVLSELLLCYSFMSSTIPCVRSFVGAFASPMLTLAGITTMNDSFVHGNSYQMRPIGRFKTHQAEIKRTNHSDVCLRPDVANYDVGIEHREGHAREQDSLASDSSEQMIIRRDTHIHVASHSQPAGQRVQ